MHSGHWISELNKVLGTVTDYSRVPTAIEFECGMSFVSLDSQHLALSWWCHLENYRFGTWHFLVCGARAYLWGSQPTPSLCFSIHKGVNPHYCRLLLPRTWLLELPCLLFLVKKYPLNSESKEPLLLLSGFPLVFCHSSRKNKLCMLSLPLPLVLCFCLFIDV